jgi:hypothetical protein
MSKSTKKTEKVRLSDTQLIALSCAAQREDGVIAISDRLKGAAAQKFAAALIEKGLAREARAKSGAPVARRDEEGRAYVLLITKLGRAVAHVDEEQPDETAVKAAPERQNSEESKSAKRPPDAGSSRRSGDSNPAEQDGSSSAAVDNRPRQGSKLASVIALLARAHGASLDELIAATGWLPHTTRAALTGLRKRGYAVERRRADAKTRYGIAAPERADAA